MVTRKNKADMRPDEALELVNYIPYADRVELRGGASLHGTLSHAAESLFSYVSGTAARMLAACDGKIFNATPGGDLTGETPLASGYSNNRWQAVNFGTAGGQFLIGVNGANTPFIYDGSTITDTSITTSSGTSADFVHISAHKQRLFFVPKDSLAFDYLPVSSVAGSASRFQLGPYCRKGGYLMAMASWTVDANVGGNDMAVLVTSEGEVLIYTGNNPGDANDWVLMGVYTAPPPVGRRCFVNSGNDLIINTYAGPISIKDLLSGKMSGESKNPLYNINPTFKQAANEFGSIFGWDIVAFEEEGLVVFNVPSTGSGAYHQFAFNRDSAAWCKFSGWNANTFVVHNKRLYFSDTTGKILKALDGTVDNNIAIRGDIKLAYNYMGDRSNNKHFTMVRPVWRSTTDLTVGMIVNTDFEDEQPTYTLTNNAEGTDWSELDWATWEWDNSTEYIFQPLENAAATGRCASAWFRTETRGVISALFAIDWFWEEGGPL